MKTINYNLEEILKAYMVAILFTEEEIVEDLEGKTIFDFSETAKEKMKKDILSFIFSVSGDTKAKAELKQYSEEMFGHNFWLSRNGHGAGFFDDNADELQKLAKAQGERWIEVNEGLIYYT